MGGFARHTAAELAAYQDGERCLVWARDRDTGESFHLADGAARALRGWTTGHLECLMPDCSDRRLTTVSRHPRRRDGFRHYAGSGGHSPESEAHQQGKAAIVDWARSHLAHEGVTVKMEASTSDRKRVADVMVTWPDASQVAIEVQYAALSGEEWRARHDSYRRSGITDVWLFGHTGKHLRNAPSTVPVTDEARVRLGYLHHAVARADLPLLWLNPVLGRVGTVGVDVPVHTAPGVTYDDGFDGVHLDVPPAEQAQGGFYADPLVDCSLSKTGMLTPSVARLRTAARHLRRVDEARRLVDAERADERDRRLRRRWTKSDVLHLRPVPTPRSVTAARCTKCGLALTPVLSASGRHILC